MIFRNRLIKHCYHPHFTLTSTPRLQVSPWPGPGPLPDLIPCHSPFCALHPTVTQHSKLHHSCFSSAWIWIFSTRTVRSNAFNIMPHTENGNICITNWSKQRRWLTTGQGLCCPGALPVCPKAERINMLLQHPTGEILSGCMLYIIWVSSQMSPPQRSLTSPIPWE